MPLRCETRFKKLSFVCSLQSLLLLACSLSTGRRKRCLGSFASEREAAEAYDKAALTLRCVSSHLCPLPHSRLSVVCHECFDTVYFATDLHGLLLRKSRLMVNTDVQATKGEVSHSAGDPLNPWHRSAFQLLRECVDGRHTACTAQECSSQQKGADAPEPEEWMNKGPMEHMHDACNTDVLVFCY